MKFFRELYDSGYNYIKGCSSIMRYLNELILKGGVKRVSLLLVISVSLKVSIIINWLINPRIFM
jgi:hypothetical protein